MTATPGQRRFGTRATFGTISVLLLVIPFGLLLSLVRARWGPLVRLDTGVTSSLHRTALTHGGLGLAMRTLSALESTPVWLAELAVLDAWLIWRRLPRLAVFATVTIAASSV